MELRSLGKDSEQVSSNEMYLPNIVNSVHFPGWSWT
jgi:hypothetical protein